ncbi:DUF3862 domain-containing protein [Permianibacter sp. IMCC34836]|nr:DUF3862 domain-containing protein [Permianibacter fluminis]
MLLTLTACSKLSNDNYNKLEAGMSKADVAAIIGEPESCESALAFETCRWGDDDKNIQVRFAADNLLAKTAEGL